MSQAGSAPLSIEARPTTVFSTSMRWTAALLHATSVTADGETFALDATPEHPFYVPDESRFVALEDLAPGDRLVDDAGRDAELLDLVATSQLAPVFNLEVEGAHDYFVVGPDGDGAVLVHNGCGRLGLATPERARELGYGPRISPQRLLFDSHGQPGYLNGKNYITPDANGHIGGVWKMFDRRGVRIGTFDSNLNRLGN